MHPDRRRLSGVALCGCAGLVQRRSKRCIMPTHHAASCSRATAFAETPLGQHGSHPGHVHHNSALLACLLRGRACAGFQDGIVLVTHRPSWSPHTRTRLTLSAGNDDRWPANNMTPFACRRSHSGLGLLLLAALALVLAVLLPHSQAADPNKPQVRGSVGADYLPMRWGKRMTADRRRVGSHVTSCASGRQADRSISHL